MCTKLNLTLCLIRAHKQNGEIVCSRSGEEARLWPVEVATVLLQAVDGVGEEIENDVDDLSCVW